ncbi:hypothetical protein EKO04_004110 [Ascochyta lentis]|uniref:Uncharacterized protein n=1 Tax=Ascochyta lentis TaxID=205686 RepID=A0A8H7J4M0_9PLEO|nr:hypothetical protein EKO04_004110 [Ascochyta lentis]
MYPAHQIQRDHMAQQTTKPQQAGPRRPHHPPHHYHNTDRARADRARPLPETPRKSHHPDRDALDPGLMKMLHRKPVPRAPLQDIHPNMLDHRSAPYQQQTSTSARKVSSAASSQAQSRMSEMYGMIDDHLAWNMPTSDIESARPGSSGTMFVDFDTNGEMEVSYRHGVNKKLPTPPVPEKSSLSRRESKKEVPRKEVRKTCEVEKQKPLPPRPSCSSRHDSVMSSGRPEDEKIDRYFDARPRPQLPPKNPRRSQIHDRVARRSHPPQVHQTQNTRQLASASPTPSHASRHSTLSSSSYHTTYSSRGQTTHIDPSDLKVHYHYPPSPTTHAPSIDSNPPPHAYLSGYDPTSKYAYSYNGRTMHVHASPTSSRRGSHTSEYFQVNPSTHRCDDDDDDDDDGGGDGIKVLEKPLPHLHPLPPGSASLPEPPRAHAKKRRGILKFVNRLLWKLHGLGVLKELSLRQRRWGSSKGVGKAQTWVENGYVT